MTKKKKLGFNPFNESKGGLDMLISPTAPKTKAIKASTKTKRGRPREIYRKITKSSQSGLREGLTRATFIVKEDTLDKLKERAYINRQPLKEIVNEALSYYLDNVKAKDEEIK